jgi:hypothetical protein
LMFSVSESMTHERMDSGVGQQSTLALGRDETDC